MDLKSCLEVLNNRKLADSNDEETWHQARSNGITGSDAQKLSNAKSITKIVASKKIPNSKFDNKYLFHGRKREVVISDYLNENYQISHNTGLFHAIESKKFLATPDGIGLCSKTNQLVLAEIKTSINPFTKVPPNYYRQIQWQMYVMGATKVLLAWEQHHDFRTFEPLKLNWIQRDPTLIDNLINLANLALNKMKPLEA